MTERTPRTELPETLQTIVKHAELGKIDAAASREQVKELTARADYLRHMANQSEKEHFQTAIDQLLQLQARAKYTDADLLRTRLELHDIDPIRERDIVEESPDQIMEHYAQLTPGTPLLGLGSYPQVGILTGKPTNLTLQPGYNEPLDDDYIMPAYFDMPLQMMTSTGSTIDHMFPITPLDLYYTTIGREAIARLASESAFTTETMSDHEIMLNHLSIELLRHQINTLYALGMEKIDTANLDAAIKQAGPHPRSQVLLARTFC